MEASEMLSWRSMVPLASVAGGEALGEGELDVVGGEVDVEGTDGRCRWWGRWVAGEATGDVTYWVWCVAEAYLEGPVLDMVGYFDG